MTGSVIFVWLFCKTNSQGWHLAGPSEQPFPIHQTCYNIFVRSMERCVCGQLQDPGVVSVIPLPNAVLKQKDLEEVVALLAVMQSCS